MSITRDHAEWRSLIEVSGPFLNLDVLAKVFPQGLDKPNDEATLRARLRVAHDEWEDGRDDAAIHQAWIQLVLSEVLELGDDVLRRGQGITANLEVRVAEHGERLRPDVVLVEPGGDKPRLLLMIVPPSQKLERAAEGQRWMASPSTRMMTLLHGADVRLGLLTNGEEWMLVRAAPNETTTFASFYATLWLEEPTTLRAFRSLLGMRRFFSVEAAKTLEAMFAESAKNPHEVTDQLGLQVRRAVELLVQAIDRIDRERGRKLLAGAREQDVFEAAVTVMMRLVFLLAAEERKLIPSVGQALYDQHYAVSTLREQLRQVADQYGEEVLERRRDAWSRLLATFRAVHGGIQYQDLRLIAYGGSLFDPDRFPFLEGRAEGTRWRESDAEPLPIENRTVLHLLEALQLLELKVPGGGPAETQRLSFRSLGVEQIGHVYEGLLDHAAVRATEPVLGLRGSKKLEPEIPLSRLDAARKKGDDALVSLLKEETGRSPSALQKDYTRYDVASAIDKQLRGVCSSSPKLYGQVKPYAGLLRTDSYGQPVVVSEGSVYVTQSSERRSTGTHYTPPSLTEPLVQHTLDPLVYIGPAEGKPREEWKLRTAAEILKLRVCDIAMGSGAFLVQACRYLAARLVEAWADAERASNGKLVVTPEGQLSTGSARERPLPTDVEERLVLARRYVADRCIYGVDINPMAVEIAKLSMWLTTLQKDRPFTFLDHALRPGDSLLGVTAPEQLEYFELRPEVERQLVLQGSELRRALQKALDARKQLESFSVVEIADAAEKARLLADAQGAMDELRVVADLLVGAVLHGGEGTRAAAGIEVTAALKSSDANRPKKVAALEFRAQQFLAERTPFHWLLEFPEVMLAASADARGFDAIVGNPPFLGGRYISGTMGSSYLAYMKSEIAAGAKGNADLVAYFLLRSAALTHSGGATGFIATKTIAEGDTHDVGLAGLCARGVDIYRATTARDWPGGAAVQFVQVNWVKGSWSGERYLDGHVVDRIASRLHVTSADATDIVYKLKQRVHPYQGSYVHGMGFFLRPEERKEIVSADPASKTCIFPCITAEDFNTSPTLSSDRYIIYFGDMDAPAASKYKGAWKHLHQHVREERQSAAGPLATYWWRFKRPTKPLYDEIWRSPRVMVCPVVTKYLSFAWISSKVILLNKMFAFVDARMETFVVLQSAIFDVWARRWSGRLGETLQFAPTDCFDNFPLEEDGVDARVGETFHSLREEAMLRRQCGLTALMNLFHTATCNERDIRQLREAAVALDNEVARTYGWEAIGGKLAFHATQQGERFTYAESVRRGIVKRLIELNHVRGGPGGGPTTAPASADRSARKVTKSRQTNQSGFDF